MDAFSYVAAENALLAEESVGVQNCIFATLIIQMLTFYFAMVAPIFMHWTHVFMFYIVYFAQIVVYDLTVSCMLRKEASMGLFNLYTVARFCLGNLQKVLILTVAYIGFFAAKEKT